MIKQLQYNGDSAYLYLTKPLLKLLRANPNEAYFLFTVNNNILNIKKIDNKDDYKDALIKKAQKNGTGYCIYIPKPVLELLDINPTTDKVDVSINEETLIVKKAIE